MLLKTYSVKLLNDLFKILERTTTESGFFATIKLFPEHVIYSGHFPGHPVTPGVIQLQIVHELMEHYFRKSLKLATVDDCKFLKIINPEENDVIQISVEYFVDNSLLQIKASGKCDSGIFFKLKASYWLENTMNI